MNVNDLALSPNDLILNVTGDRVDVDIVRESGDVGPLLIDIGYCHSDGGLTRLDETFALTLDVVEGLTEDGEIILSREQSLFHNTHVTLGGGSVRL